MEQFCIMLGCTEAWLKELFCLLSITLGIDFLVLLNNFCIFKNSKIKYMLHADFLGKMI
jgi:hypothetical protein